MSHIFPANVRERYFKSSPLWVLQATCFSGAAWRLCTSLVHYNKEWPTWTHVTAVSGRLDRMVTEDGWTALYLTQNTPLVTDALGALVHLPRVTVRHVTSVWRPTLARGRRWRQLFHWTQKQPLLMIISLLLYNNNYYIIINNKLNNYVQRFKDLIPNSISNIINVVTTIFR